MELNKLEFNLQGMGSVIDPYLIKTTDDFKMLSDNYRENNYYQDKVISLECDIEVSSTIEDFRGTFRGNNHKITTDRCLFRKVEMGIISDLIIRLDRPLLDVRYLVGTLCNSNHGTIVNCNVDAANFMSVNDSMTSAGLLVGDNFGTISNCQSVGEMIVNSKSRLSDFGGISGYNSGKIENCGSLLRVNSDDTVSTISIGGITGSNKGDVIDCDAEVYITVQGSRLSVAGIVGMDLYDDLRTSKCLRKCKSSGSITIHDITSSSKCSQISNEEFIPVEDCESSMIIINNNLETDERS